MFSNRRHNDICSDNSELGALSHDLTDIIKYSCSEFRRHGLGHEMRLCEVSCEVTWCYIRNNVNSQKEPGLTEYVLQGLSDSLSQRLILLWLGHAPWSRRLCPDVNTNWFSIFIWQIQVMPRFSHSLNRHLGLGHWLRLLIGYPWYVDYIQDWS